MLPLPPNFSINLKLRTENDYSLLRLEIVLLQATIFLTILLFSAYMVPFAHEHFSGNVSFLPSKHCVYEANFAIKP